MTLKLHSKFNTPANIFYCQCLPQLYNYNCIKQNLHKGHLHQTYSLLLGRWQRINKKSKNLRLWINVDMKDQQFYPTLSSLLPNMNNIMVRSPWLNIKILQGSLHSARQQDSSYEIGLQDVIFYSSFSAFVSKSDSLQLITTTL